MIQEVRRIRRHQAKAAKALSDAYKLMTRTFPVGCRVQFKKGNGLVTAEVTRWVGEYNHSAPGVFVRNIGTGKEYRISACYLLDGEKIEGGGA